MIADAFNVTIDAFASDNPVAELLQCHKFAASWRAQTAHASQLIEQK